MSQDKLAIRELIENWAVWRDSFSGTSSARSGTGRPDVGDLVSGHLRGVHRGEHRGLQAKGVRIYHFLGGTSIDIKGKRAIAQTKMSISQRAKVEGVECDVLCIGRFYDFLEKRKGQWGLVWRRLTYEKDQIVPVDPAKAPKLDPKLLARFPVGYKHLAYLQTKVGYKVKDGHAGRRWAGNRQALRLGRRTGSRAQHQEDRVVSEPLLRRHPGEFRIHV